MIAQAGATFNVLGTQPLQSPAIPSSLKMCQRNLGMDRSSGANTFAAPEDGPVSWKTCRRVFPTSNGVVTTDAIAPDVAPATKLSTNVAL
jgi:hypothetical protein